MDINDLVDIKNYNAKSILNCIRFHETLTKKDITNLTNLSFGTVSTLSNNLKAKGILTDFKADDQRIGRIPNTLTICENDYFVMALDLQLENTLGFSILNLKRKVAHQQFYNISHLHTVGGVVSFSKKIFEEFLKKNSYNDAKFIGIGVAVPAVYDTLEGTLVLSALPMFENAPLKELLQKEFKLPVYIDNIANIHVFAEYTSCPEINNIVCMDVSQGVGVGVICDGKLLRGKNGYATEVAHVIIGNPSLRCPSCGGYGCVENELSLLGMIECLPGIDSTLPLLKRWELFVESMLEPTERTRKIAMHVGELAGKLATILINLFDPEAFFVSGYITDIFPLLAPYFYQEIDLRCKMALNRGIKIFTEEDAEKKRKVFVGLSDMVYDRWNPMV